MILYFAKSLKSTLMVTIPHRTVSGQMTQVNPSTMTIVIPINREVRF